MRLLLVFCLLISGSFAFSQNIFQNISFEEAVAKARQEGKLIFIQFESADCNQCNEVANKGLDNATLRDKLSAGFVCVRISPSHPDRDQIGSLYNISKGFGSLFINMDKTLLLSFRSSSSRSDEYFQQVDVALQKAGESLKIAELEKEYDNGNRSPGFMELYIQKRRALNLPIDELLEIYVISLPADSLNSVRTLGFIAQMAPILGSRADDAFRKNQMLFSRAWYVLSPQQRVSINSEIIAKSRSLAIKEKNEEYARVIATFAQSTYVGNLQAGVKSYEFNMMEYYRQVNDTSQFFPKAVSYYNRYYMSLSVDSLKSVDSAYQRRLFAQAPVKDSIVNGSTKKVYKTVAFAPSLQIYANALNNAAWNFYQTTSNPALLAIATAWSQRALEYFESPEVLDTYARLLYKQGQKQLALQKEQSLIELKKKRGFPTKENEVILARMKSGQPIE